MTTTVRFPSAEFPALPHVSAQIPEAWTLAHPAGAVIAAVRPAPAGTFTPNILVSVTRFGPEHTLQATIDALRTRVGSFPEHAWGKESSAATESGARYAVEVSYTDPAAGTLLQVHRFVLIDHGPVRDLVHAVGVCAAAQVEDVVPELRATIGSLDVGE